MRERRIGKSIGRVSATSVSHLEILLWKAQLIRLTKYLNYICRIILLCNKLVIGMITLDTQGFCSHSRRGRYFGPSSEYASQNLLPFFWQSLVFLLMIIDRKLVILSSRFASESELYITLWHTIPNKRYWKTQNQIIASYLNICQEKGSYSQICSFSISPIWMWELGHKEG